MPKVDKITDNKYSKENTGADFNRALGVLKDTLVILDADMVSSRIVPTSFKYLMGSSELEVYLNGVLMRVNQAIDGTVYGDYTENSNFSVKFNAGNPDFVVGAKVRFRVTAANYKICSSSGGGGIDPTVITELQNDVTDLTSQLTGLSNLIYQIGRDSFGTSYAFIGNPAGSTRTVGVISDGDTTPNVRGYRTWRTANTSLTLITNFTGITEDERTILVDDNFTVFVHNPAILVLPDGNDILAESGEIYNFIYEGSVWKLNYVGGEAITKSGMEKWKQISGYTTVLSTSTLRMVVDYASDETIIPGMALRYKISGSYYYGVCDAITPGILTIKGAPFNFPGTVQELWIDESLTKTLELVVPIEGYYEDRTELVTNGTFGSDTSGWTASNATLSIDASGYLGTNCLKIANTGIADGKAYQDITTVVGEEYYIHVYFKKGTATHGKFTIGTTSNDSSIYAGTNLVDVAWTGHYHRFIATETTTRIVMLAAGGAALTAFFDYICLSAVETDLLRDFCNYYFKWTKPKSYCVNFGFISKTVDTGDFLGRGNVTLDGDSVHTSAEGLEIATDELLVETTVDINTTNYDINYGEYLEISATPGGMGDATDLSVFLTFVLP